MTSVHVLPVDECRRLLEVGLMGRLAVVTRAGEILMIPVNYAVVDDAVVVRTADESRLGEEVRAAGAGVPPRAAFEVDVIDHERWRGWSVVAHGGLEAVDAADLAGHRLPRAWADGERHLFVRMPLESITGVRLGAGWDPESAMPVRVVL